MSGAVIDLDSDLVGVVQWGESNAGAVFIRDAFGTLRPARPDETALVLLREPWLRDWPAHRDRFRRENGAPR